jgi:hypothetical protein
MGSVTNFIILREKGKASEFFCDLLFEATDKIEPRSTFIGRS